MVPPAEVGGGVAGLDRVELDLRHGLRVLERQHRDCGFARAVDDRGIAGCGPLGVGDGPERAERAGDVDHDRVPGLAQQRHRGLGDPDDADHIGVEYLQRVGAVERWHRNAGVVDQHVQAPLGVADRRHRGGDGGVVGDIELDEACTNIGGCLLPSLGAARPGIHGVAEFGQLACALVADALVRASDQDDGHIRPFRNVPALSAIGNAPRQRSAQPVPPRSWG